MGYSRGRGPVLGKPVTEEWLGRNGVSGILRGHQHNNSPAAGPMLTRLRQHKGLYDNWGGAGLVYTFLSAAETAMLGFDASSIGQLRFSQPSGDQCPPGHGLVPPPEPANEWAPGRFSSNMSLWHCHAPVPAQRVKVGQVWRRSTRPSTPMSESTTQHTNSSLVCVTSKPWLQRWYGSLPLVHADQQESATVKHACEHLAVDDLDSGFHEPSLQCDRVRG